MSPISYVLVVDDDYATVDFLCEALTDEGYVVLSATDGRSALRQIAAQAPALLVVDLWMPEMSGVELIARLHEGGLACFPIVVISGSLDGQLLNAPGVSDVLAKPFELEALLACVAQYVQPSSAISAAQNSTCTKM